MVTHGEKMIFGFMGAITAIVVSLAIYFDYKPATRSPASEYTTPMEEKPASLYFYYID